MTKRIADQRSNQSVLYFDGLEYYKSSHVVTETAFIVTVVTIVVMPEKTIFQPFQVRAVLLFYSTFTRRISRAARASVLV